jgi:hypothetical protein
MPVLFQLVKLLGRRTGSPVFKRRLPAFKYRIL